MNHTPNYRKATNAAYQLLVQMESFTLTTNVMAIAENLVENCSVITYGQACYFYGCTRELLFKVSEFGFSIINDGKRVILYNEDAPLGSIRFTIAHEIGHAVLGHLDEDDPGAEKEANCFARNLLCPAPVVCGLGLDDPMDFVRVFTVTERMANVTINWTNSDIFYIRNDLWEQVFDMFMEFIENCSINGNISFDTAS